MPGNTAPTPVTPTILGVATAVNFSKGVPGAVGVANDTIVLGVKILKNAGPATLTINSGYRREDGTQDTTHYIFTGSTTQDTLYTLNWLNTAGPLQMTASVAFMVIVETMPSGFVP